MLVDIQDILGAPGLVVVLAIQVIRAVVVFQDTRAVVDFQAVQVLVAVLDSLGNRAPWNRRIDLVNTHRNDPRT